MRRSLKFLAMLPVGICVVLALAGCRRTQSKTLLPPSPPPSHQGWQVVQSPRGYRIELPPGWKYQCNPTMIDMQAFPPPQRVAENVNIIIEKLHEPTTCAEYAQHGYRYLTPRLQENYHAGTPQAFAGQLSGMKVISTMSIRGRGVKFCQYYFIQAKTAYTVTCVSTPKNYAHVEPEFDQIAKTFTLPEK